MWIFLIVHFYPDFIIPLLFHYFRVSCEFPLICPGTKVWCYADPIGAIIISIYILGSWFVTGWGEYDAFMMSLAVYSGRLYDKGKNTERFGPSSSL